MCLTLHSHFNIISFLIFSHQIFILPSLSSKIIRQYQYRFFSNVALSLKNYISLTIPSIFNFMYNPFVWEWNIGWSCALSQLFANIKQYFSSFGNAVSSVYGSSFQNYHKTTHYPLLLLCEYFLYQVIFTFNIFWIDYKIWIHVKEMILSPL